MDKNLAPGVRMLAVSTVVPEPAAAPAVEKETAKVIKLSFLDAPWVATPPVQQLFVYEGAGGGDEFRAVVARLKASLAAALALYLPLAGKLGCVEATRELVVDCSDPGVAFLEAEAMAGCVDARRLARGAGSAAEVASLFPAHDTRALPAPALTVQATRLHAGMALGVSVLHAVVDGRAFVQFMDAWSSIARGGVGEGASPATASPAPPHYSRVAIAAHAHPCSDDLAHHVVSKVAPNLPVVASATTEDEDIGSSSRLGRHTFVLGEDNIRSLKQRINALSSSLSPSNSTRQRPVSSFAAVSALSWVAFVQAKGMSAGQDTHLLFQVDLRGRLQPPVGDGYAGNCVRGCIASADAGELLGAAGLLHASRAIQAAVREAVAAPLEGMEAWLQRILRLPVARQACVGGSPQFRVFQTADFGFGMPDHVVPVSMPGSPATPPPGGAGVVELESTAEQIALSGGKWDGQVHVSVAFDPLLVDAFESHINGGTAHIRSKF